MCTVHGTLNSIDRNNTRDGNYYTINTKNVLFRLMEKIQTILFNTKTVSYIYKKMYIVNFLKEKHFTFGQGI